MKGIVSSTSFSACGAGGSGGAGSDFCVVVVGAAGGWIAGAGTGGAVAAWVGAVAAADDAAVASGFLVAEKYTNPPAPIAATQTSATAAGHIQFGRAPGFFLNFGVE